MKTKKILSLFALFLLVSLAGAQAFTWHVDARGSADAGGTSPEDALPSLQAAIDRAGDGDVILVAKGQYAPVSVASDRSLTILSTDGPEKTFLAGDGQTRCAVFADETGEAARLVTLEGFTLVEGVDDSDIGGGGVLGGNLVNCVLRDNVAVRGGAARGAHLENCLLSGNVAALGGGAFDSELVNCTVVGNRADGTGGGVCGCKLSNSIVQANDSPDGVDAAGSCAVFSCTTPLLEGEGNSDADACFVDAETGDWRLAKGSPCLDAGDGGFCTSATDLAGNERVAGDVVDLGAFEGAWESIREFKVMPTISAVMVTIVFDPNGGTCDPREMTFPAGTNYSDLPHPSRKGYIFTGWYTAVNGGIHITTNTVVSLSHKKVYAHWVRAVTVRFDANGGTCATQTRTFRVGKKYPELPHPSRKGYIYTGWYTAAEGGTHITTNTVASLSHKKVYAHWARAVTIRFDANGGTCATRTKTFRVGKKYGGLPRPTRPHYVHIGWFTAAEGGTLITSNTVASLSHQEFHAHWARAVEVFFNPNGGSCSVRKKTYGLGQPFGSLPTPKRSGYTSSGWYTPAGVLVKTNSTVATTRTNLVAHWMKNLSVHPVGDSMTYGVRTRHNPLLNGASASAVAQISNQGWRGYLRQSLLPWGKNRGRAIVFVGKHPQSSIKGNVPHDGYCGEDASTYVRYHGAASSVEADVQIVFLGMNDAITISKKGGDPGRYFRPTQDGYAQVLSSLHAGSSTPLTILITEPKVTPLIVEHNRIYKPSAINNVITGYINPYIRSRQGRKVKILDIQTLYSNSSYTDDGFHLSVEGNKVIASRLDKLIKDFWNGK